MGERMLRATAWTAAALTGLAALFVIAGLPVYVFPPAAPAPQPGEADLIYVIGPPAPERIALERALREQGVADLSLYSVGRSGRNSAKKLPVCSDRSVYCENPQPFTTKGEFALLAEFAAEHDVRRTIVLTFTPHVARTRYIAEKCFAGEVTVVGVDQSLSLGEWVYQYLYQTAAFVKAAATPCASLEDESDE